MRLKIGPSSSVTQGTSKSTAVICEGPGNIITMHNAALAATTSVSFTVTNSYVAAGDVPVIAIASGGTASSYVVTPGAVAAGSYVVHVRNITAGSLGEALVLNVGIVKLNV